MADQKLTQLTAITSVTDDDLIYIVDDPGGSPLSRKITVLDFKGSFGLTDFTSNGNWKVFYTDGTGAVTELALGASGDVLQSNGAAAAPSWVTPSAGDGNGIYDGSGSLTGTTTVTMATNDITFNSTTGDFKFLNSTAGGQFLVGTDVYDPSFSVVGNVTKMNGASGANDFLGGGIYWATQSVNGTRLSLGNVGLCHDDGSGTINAIVSSFLGAGMTVGTHSDHDYFIRTNNTQRVKIENTGEVAIGNITPLELLHVDGNVRADGAFKTFTNISDSKLLLQGNTTNSNFSRIGAGALVGAGATSANGLYIDAQPIATTTTFSQILALAQSINASANRALYGNARNGASTSIAVQGDIAGGMSQASSSYTAAILGSNSASLGNIHYGGYFTASAVHSAATNVYAVRGQANRTGGNGNVFGGHFEAKSNGASAANTAVYAEASAGLTNISIHSAAGLIKYDGQTATGASAGADTLPSNPVGFINIDIDGTTRKIPYYAT